MGMCASADAENGKPTANAPQTKDQTNGDEKSQSKSPTSTTTPADKVEQQQQQDAKAEIKQQDGEAKVDVVVNKTDDNAKVVEDNDNKTEDKKGGEEKEIVVDAAAPAEDQQEKQSTQNNNEEQNNKQKQTEKSTNTQQTNIPSITAATTTTTTTTTTAQKDMNNHNADPVSTSATKLTRTNSYSSIIDPVNLEVVAPLPTTRSPHALPRGAEDLELEQDTEIRTALKPFKNGVAKVLYHRRIWSRLGSELDAAEEGDLLNRVEFGKKIDSMQDNGPDPANAMTDGTPGQENSRLSSNSTKREKAINTPKLTTKERQAKRRVYDKHIRDYQIQEVDTYPAMEHVSDDFLWLLSYSQHKARVSIPKHPAGKGAKVIKNGRQFDVAQLPPLDDNTQLTQAWIDQMIVEFRAGKVLSYNDTFQILRRVAKTYLPEQNCVPVKIPRDATCTVVGDLHGQLDDLLMVLREAGHPSPTHRMLFNGDFVDRGAFSCEVVLILFAYRALYPRYVYTNRGNHEGVAMNTYDGFLKECELKYSVDLFWYFNHVFATLPIAHLITVGHQRVFVVHAGLSFEDITIEEINYEDRFKTDFAHNSILQDLLWSDPMESMGRQISRRGAGCLFGPDVVNRFLIKNNVHLIIRSHECEDSGFALWADNRMYTIFSASNYTGDVGNYGAFCVLSQAPSPQIRVFSAKQSVAKYSERQLQIRQSLLAKLLVRIASRIFDLEATMVRISEERGTPGLIPPFAWSFALMQGLGLDAAFLPLALKLGVNVDHVGRYVSPDRLSTKHSDTTYTAPYSDDDRATRQLSMINTAGEVAKRCILNPKTGKIDDVLIDIAAWVNKFKPSDIAPTDLRGRISALLYDTTSPFMSGLERLFDHFDTNKDGFISAEELTVGLGKLLTLLGIDEGMLTQDNILDLVQSVDLNNDGEIDYNEFFKAFAYGHLKLVDQLKEDE